MTKFRNVSASMVFRNGFTLLVVILCLDLCLSGCGGKETSQPVADSHRGQTVNQAPVATPTQPKAQDLGNTDVDFASIEKFPDISFCFSEDLAPNGNSRFPLVEGNTVQDASGNPAATYWAATVPATYEITLPGKAVIHRVEVLGPCGTIGIPECVVFLKRSRDGNWERPTGLVYEKRFAGTDEDGDMTKHVFSFDKTHAVGVLLGFAVGCERDPSLVHVRDIKVIGHSGSK